ncbi:MAG: ABC transporter ATP-binding protein/permease, partial [Cellulomonas sp.]|nr:ABC transporter ATP-binding protein/permease [Cellulomonas sp.]
MPVAKAMNFVGSGKRLLRSLRPEAARLMVVVVLTVGSVALAVAGPKLLGNATNAVFSGAIGQAIGQELEKDGIDPSSVTIEQVSQMLAEQGGTQARMADMIKGMDDLVIGQGIDFERLAEMLAWVLAVYVASFLFGWFAARLSATVVQNTARRMRDDVEAKLSRLPLKYVDGQPRGELLSRVTNDIDNVAQSLQQTMSQLVTALLTVVGVLVMMFWISWMLALVALVTVPLSGAVAMMIGKRAQPNFVGQWKHTGEVNAHIEEMFTGHNLVTVFNKQAEAQRVFDERNEALYAASFKAMFISGVMQPAMGFIANINYLIIAVVGGLRVASGTMSLGDVQAFIQYSRQFSQPITQIASMANLMQSGVASAERVFELLDTPEQDPDPVPAASLPENVQGRVAFEDVSFRYESHTPLIEHLDLVAEPGQTVAIVGPTGAGKTTLVNLVMRFYEVDSGQITLDGVDTRTLTRDDLRSQIGMVLQDTWLYSGTIADNIGYGIDGATREQVVEAAKATYVDRFVGHLPDGYDTMIDDEGGTVSTGEKQLLTIARAFLADRSILILDEATSSVDTRTEVLVQQAMAALRKGRTSFVIAHRLSTIRDADVILVMEHGEIVEQGSHEQLLAAGGAYAR